MVFILTIKFKFSFYKLRLSLWAVFFFENDLMENSYCMHSNVGIQKIKSSDAIAEEASFINYKIFSI